MYTFENSFLLFLVVFKLLPPFNIYNFHVNPKRKGFEVIFLIIGVILCCCGLLINITHSWYLVIDMNDCSIFIKLRTNKYNLWTFCDLRSADFSYPQSTAENKQPQKILVVRYTNHRRKQQRRMYIVSMYCCYSFIFIFSSHSVQCFM